MDCYIPRRLYKDAGGLNAVPDLKVFILNMLCWLAESMRHWSAAGGGKLVGFAFVWRSLSKATRRFPYYTAVRLGQTGDSVR